MKRSELQHHLGQALRRVHLVATLVLCAAGLVGPAHAAGSVVKTVPEMTQAVAQANPMSSAFDGLPCASCYMAPAPTVHGFTGEYEEPKQAAWQLLAEPSASAQKTLYLQKRACPCASRTAVGHGFKKAISVS